MRIEPGMRLAFTVHNRPEYLKETLDSWLDVRGFFDVPVTFALEPTARESDMVAVIEHAMRGRHQNWVISTNPRKFGVLLNPFEAMTREFVAWGADFAVLAEEDVVVSSDVLEYFEWARRQFWGELRVGAVGAFGLGENGQAKPQDVDFGPFNPLVWGTWAYQWMKHIGPSWDLDYSSGLADGTPSGWDWNLNLRVLPKMGAQVLRPLQSRSTHIGFEGGVHYRDTPEERAGAVASTFKPWVAPAVPYTLIERKQDFGTD